MGLGLKITAGAVGLLVIVGSTVALGADSTATSCTAGTVSVTDAAASPPIANYKGEQLANAAAIMNVAAGMGLDARAQAIGVMTAMGESSLKNLTYGDEGQGVTNPDGSPTTSIGLFQQQDSWGSRSDRLDPTKAATMFYSRMVGVEGWESMAPSAVAHKVQINADPNHYTRWWGPAEEVVARLAGASEGGGGCSTTAYPLDEGYNLTSDYGPRNTGIPGASTWHPAIDAGGSCKDPVYAVQQGTVTRSDRLWLSIEHPDGYVISYLHMYKTDRLVDVGDAVAPGQQIGAIGNEGPSSGCHLDVRINVEASTNASVNALARSESIGGPAGYVNPERFFELFGLDLCPPDWCNRAY